ncbi:MAG: hypothetical protein IPG00_14155 [Saprospiraceae bacterium]|nr:hypothetical protein [Saprospiraceae bacterium]
MKIVNLTVAGGYKPETEIARFFGKDSLPNGATSFRKKGIGGLTFWDPQDEDRKHKFKCIMVAFPDGLGVYCRNHRANYLVLIHKRELKSIDFVKEQDTIKPYAWSLYSLMMKAGVSYHTASKYLMPVEIIHHDSAKCILHTEETFLTFELDKAHPDKLISFLKEHHFQDILNNKILSPKIIAHK